MEELMTTRQAAKLLGVGTTSIKRWADSGLLECVKTPGGHRRFPRVSVESLVGRTPDAQPEHSSEVAEWVTLLRSSATHSYIYDALMSEYRGRGSWAAVADALGDVLAEVGCAWARGDLTVIEEHVATERLQRCLQRVCESLRVDLDAPASFLLTAEGDEHGLGLLLTEMSLRENGWRPIWAGSRTPVHFACEYIATAEVRMVAVSASQNSRDSVRLADQCMRLEQSCRARELLLVLGGGGLWPETPDYAIRVHSCTELGALLKSERGRAYATRR